MKITLANRRKIIIIREETMRQRSLCVKLMSEEGKFDLDKKKEDP
ncbi:hypothetical protein IRB23M11_02380 [Alkalibacterium sp. m-11]